MHVSLTLSQSTGHRMVQSFIKTRQVLKYLIIYWDFGREISRKGCWNMTQLQVTFVNKWCFACSLVPGSLIRSALWQTTCLLIPLNAPPLSQVPSQLEMLEKLLKSGCHLVAGRMSILNNEQRKHIADILEVSSVGSERVRSVVFLQVTLDHTFLQTV